MRKKLSYITVITILLLIAGIVITMQLCTSDKKENSNDEPIVLDYTDYNNGVINLNKYMGVADITSCSDLSITSPDKVMSFQLYLGKDQSLYYSLTAADDVLVEASKLGLTLKEADLSCNLAYDASSIKLNSIAEAYETYTLGFSTADNTCNELSVTFTNEKGSFDLIVRIYDDGFAYRYDNVTVKNCSSLTVTNELSEIILPTSASYWSFALNATYEGEYINRSNEAMTKNAQTMSTPMLANIGKYWMMISEASVFNNNGEYCSSALRTETASRNLVWTFGLARTGNDETIGELISPGHTNIVSVETISGFTTPWRAFVISADMDTFANSSLISDLNPAPDANVYADTSYIIPGKVAWSWWSEDTVQGDYNKHIEYIDFASENRWEYVCLDAGWPAFESRLFEMCEYAKSKGVGIFVWVNYKDIKNSVKMDSLFKAWSEAGIVGLKTDYFESDEANVLKVMQDSALCAAKYRLMILYHGCVRPAGEYRTYPNVLTMEAVQGEEWHKWNAFPTIANCLVYPFTRNICGSMDYTPVGTKVGSNTATYGFGLAQTVVYESALTHLAYAASSYKSYSGLSFLNNLKTSWDQSILVDGYPGKYATFARRNGSDWYIGSMTLEAREVKIALDFLDEGTYNAYIYKDNADQNGLDIEMIKVTKSDNLDLSLCASGGAAVIITTGTIDTSVGFTEDSNNKAYTYIEAEAKDNLLKGAAVLASSAFCSGSQKVGYIGNSGNTLTFTNVTVQADGTYNLLLFYCCGEKRNLTLKINGDKTYELTDLYSGDYVHPTSATINIELKAGINTIELLNDKNYAPDIDRIAISKEAQ